MTQPLALEEAKLPAGSPDRGPDWPEPVAAGLARLRTGIVNVYFLGAPGAGDRGWVLVDAGLPRYAGLIREAAARRFGPDARPSAIVLTHGHFDHVGSLLELADGWDVPVYAHPLESPYITGKAAYPPADPTVGGGALAALSWLFPPGPFEVHGRFRELPDGGEVPGAPGWRWMFTPGHSPGHVSLYRDSDRTLIAGDAFVTTKQESAVAVLTQFPELNGPPKYYTIDWPSAKRSVRELAALAPEIAATGHGRPLAGESLREALNTLARDFDRMAVPRQGRYAHSPVFADATGPRIIPPAVQAPWATMAKVFAVGLVGGLAVAAVARRR